MPVFQLHRSNRLERLVGALGDLLAEPVGGPLAPDAVVVQGRGMEIWLGGELAKRFDVWASRMLYPRELVERLVKTVLGPDALGDPPLSEDLLAWSIQGVLPELLGEPDFAALARYVANDPRGMRLRELSERIATVFDQYLTYRPDWLRAWELGEPVVAEQENRWQALLWQRVARRLARPHLGSAGDALIERLQSGQRLPGLPPRALVFGVSTLPPLYVRVLAALSRHVDVHFFLFSVSPEPALPGQPEPLNTDGSGERAEDNSLSSSLGRLGSDFDRVLHTASLELGVDCVRSDLHEPPATDSLIGALQADLFRPLGPSPLGLVQGSTAEISVHSCHGPMREVEVLRDQLLAVLTRKEQPIAPEEVVVLVPDLATYAPLIEAVTARDLGDRDFIPYHVADRSERQGAPVVDGMLRILSMVRGRVTASEVFDLLVLEPVGARFGLDTAAIESLRGWVARSGVRWGIDAEHRAELGLPNDAANTWAFGLRRLLLGYAMPAGERRLFEGVLPFDEIEGKEAELLGQLAWFSRSLFAWLRELERPRTLAEWAGTLLELGEACFDLGRDGTRQLGRLSRVLDAAVRNARAADFAEPVDVQVLHELLKQAADAAGADRGFLSGGVTFCAMVPMRSIPFKVVCLLGMNDGDFPRSPRPIEFDLIKNGSTPSRPGDRSRREDDRYLFLETLCAARERIIITYTGQSVRDDRKRMPSVCVAELLDYLGERCQHDGAADASAETAEPRARARARFVVEHPLQGFSPRYFNHEEPQLFSYSEAHAEAAEASRSSQKTQRLFIERSMQRPESREIGLEELVKFFKSPPAYFLNRRLGLYLRQEHPATFDREPLELDALESWKLGSALIGYLLDDVPLDQAEQLLRGKGELPLGPPGKILLERLHAPASDIATRAKAARAGAALEPLEVRVDLPDGTRVTGSIGDRWAGGAVKHMYSTPGCKYLLESWTRHVAMCAVPGASAKTQLIGRAGASAAVVGFDALASDAARALLADMVELYRRGLERPLPFMPETSHKYFAGHQKSAAAALDSAMQTYSGDEHAESLHDPHPGRAFSGLLPPFDPDFEAGKKRLDETDFHALAIALFGPLDAARAEAGT